MNEQQIAKTLKSLGLPRVYQLGIVVHSIEKALPFYTEFMGIAPWYRGVVAEMKTIYQGKEIEADVDMIFGYSGRMMIEVIEPKSGDANIYSEYLNEKGEGLHHLGIEVRDYEGYMKRVSEMGIPVIQSGALKSKGGAMSKFAYIDTTEWCGYPIEIMETRLFGIPVGKGKFMMNVGCLLGDAEKVK